MATDTVLNELILQEVTQAELKQLEKDNLLDENRVYLTPDNSLKGTLLDFKWADHLLNDISWLRADTFSWQSGDVYVAAYNHLVDDAFSVTINGEKYYAWHAGILSGIIYYTKSFTPNQGDIVYEESGTGGMIATEYTVTSVAGNELTLSDGSIVSADVMFVFTDTIGDTTIKYYRAADGHKICLPDQEDKLLELYNATGVAWYYILDTANKQFKLPRSKHEHYGDRSVVGNGTPFTLTTNEVNGANMSQYNNLYQVSKISGVDSIPVNTLLKISSDPTKSGIISTPVEDTDQYKYLYFYVGNFERDAVEQTAGVTTEMLNNKADVDLSNMSASQSAKETIVGWGMPDYSAGVSAPSTNTIAQTDIYVKSDTQTSVNSRIYINDVIVASGWESFVCAYVPKGATFRVIGANAVYYPLKGVN